MKEKFVSLLERYATTPEMALSGIKEIYQTKEYNDDSATLTVFTCTYNRADLIGKCYEALTKQTCDDFVWLVIDDGSTDNTGELVKGWIAEEKIPIKYVKQENRGMAGAHNTAHTLIRSELTVACDSDDHLTYDAVETITSIWKEKRNEKYSGIIGHDATPDGKILAKIPDEFKETTLYDLRYRNGIYGDYKLVYRTDLLKKELYPMIEGEKYVAVGYKYFLMDRDYISIITQKVLCEVEYQPDSGTNNKIKQYVRAPKGFMYYRLKMMPRMHSFKRRWHEAVHYVSSAKIAKEKHYLKQSPCKLETVCAIPFGIALSFVIKRKYRKKYGNI